MISNNSVVSIRYEIRDVDINKVIDSNTDKKPLDFLMGLGQVIDGLEENIMGASIGDKLNFVVEPSKAYGIRQPELVQEVNRSQFGDIKLEKGMSLFGQAEDGSSVQVIIVDFNNETVLIDYNHPLAGKSLEFNVEILDVREATSNEIESASLSSKKGGCGCGGCGCH